MEPFHYFAGFSTFVCTLAIAHVLKGFSDLVEARRRVRWDWIYLSLLALVLPTVAVEWWVIFRWRFFAEWTLYHFLFLLLKPTLLYFLATLLVPRITEHGEIDLWAHLQSIRPMFFWSFMLYAALDLPDTALKGRDYFMSLMPEAVIVPVINVLLNASAALTTSRRYLAFYVVAAWLLVILLPLLTRTLGALR